MCWSLQSVACNVVDLRTHTNHQCSVVFPIDFFSESIHCVVRTGLEHLPMQHLTCQVWEFVGQSSSTGCLFQLYPWSCLLGIQKMLPLHVSSIYPTKILNPEAANCWAILWERCTKVNPITLKSWILYTLVAGTLHYNMGRKSLVCRS